MCRSLSQHFIRCILYIKGECDAALGAEFVFSVRSKELIIGDVYVRIYNEQPTFPLEVHYQMFFVNDCSCSMTINYVNLC